MGITPADHETILRAIEAWPVEEQERLARMILAHALGERAQTGPSGGTSVAPPRSTWDALYGIAAGEHEPPSDEEVAQWLDEHKMEKYGH